MSQFSKMQCEPCRVGAPPVTSEERGEWLVKLPEWQLSQCGGADCLERRFEFKDFAQALAFTNRLGALAEAEGHHPAILTEWGRVTVQWWTHKINGLHKNDFICAAKTDVLSV